MRSVSAWLADGSGGRGWAVCVCVGVWVVVVMGRGCWQLPKANQGRVRPVCALAAMGAHKQHNCSCIFQCEQGWALLAVQLCCNTALLARDE